MVASGGHEKARLGVAVIAEDRHDHGDVGQVGAAGIGVVEGEGLARLQRRIALAHRPHAGAHRTQMHRHVRRIGHQPAVGVEQGAGKVQPLLDIDRVGGAFQRRAHGLGHAHEAAVEQLQSHRVGRRKISLDAADRGRLVRQADQAVGFGARGPAWR